MVRSQKRRTKQKLAKEQEKDTVQILVTLLKQKLDLKQNIKSLLTLITLTGAYAACIRKTDKTKSIHKT